MVVAFAAGLLSTLSPCVLPLIPLVFGAAVSRHRLGPLALAAGLAVSFTILGLLVATVGFALGLTADVFRVVAAVLLMMLGVVLIVPSHQTYAVAAGPALGTWAQERFNRVSDGGLLSQFAVGLLLGAIWTPCVGPTLGAASLLASQGENLGQVTLVMLAFGVGTAVPLIILGFVSQEAMLRWRGRLVAVGSGGKAVLGAVLIASGVIVLSGLDKTIETLLVRIMPDWMTRLTTMY